MGTARQARIKKLHQRLARQIDAGSRDGLTETLREGLAEGSEPVSPDDEAILLAFQNREIGILDLQKHFGPRILQALRVITNGHV